jgi:uncharacterized protein (TIGR03382 family)
MVTSAATSVDAQPAPPREIVSSIESTIVDAHATWIGMNFGSTGGGPLGYSSLVRDDGWAGTLTGDYLGRSIGVSYTGLFTPDVGGSGGYDIAWTSAWDIDGVTYSETGSGVLEPLRSEWRVTISTSGAVGASGTFGSWVGNITISGEKDLGAGTLSARVRAAVIDVPRIGALADAVASFILYQRDGRFESVFFTEYFFGAIRRTIAENHGSLIDRGDGSSDNSQTIQITPAPATAAFVAAGLAWSRRRRRV